MRGLRVYCHCQVETDCIACVYGYDHTDLLQDASSPYSCYYLLPNAAAIQDSHEIDPIRHWNPELTEPAQPRQEKSRHAASVNSLDRTRRYSVPYYISPVQHNTSRGQERRQTNH